MSSKRFKTMAVILSVLALGSILLVACTRPGPVSTGGGGGSTTTSRRGGGGTGGGGGSSCANGTVQTGASTFEQPCFNVTKGASLKFVPAATSLHILTNGSWVNGNQQLAKEPGAPSLNNVNLSSTPISIGPFITAATFHILSPLLPRMNLTSHFT